MMPSAPRAASERIVAGLDRSTFRPGGEPSKAGDGENAGGEAIGGGSLFAAAACTHEVATSSASPIQVIVPAFEGAELFQLLEGHHVGHHLAGMRPAG